MIRIDWDPASLQPPESVWWAGWNERSTNATEALIDSFEKWLGGSRKDPLKLTFNADIWKELKDWLLKNVFFRKCAYCERRISGYYGDAEHYRPKAAVKFRDPNGNFDIPVWEIPVEIPGTSKHPGYFWLAYDWRNLVPACVYCNSGRGKNERFDVGGNYTILVPLTNDQVKECGSIAVPRESRRWPGYYYLSPQSLDEVEDPFLLNPLNASSRRNPRDHIRFGVRGIVSAVDESKYGLNCIQVFHLDDEELTLERQEAQETFQDDYFDALRKADLQTPGSASAAQDLIVRYHCGAFPFSACALDFHQILKQRIP